MLISRYKVEDNLNHRIEILFKKRPLLETHCDHKKDKNIGKQSCEALILTSIERPILSIAKCDDNNYYICGRAPNECRINHETIRSGNTLSLTKDLVFGEDDIKLLVDFHKDKIVYRVQGKSCFIGYPHGCIIDGFSWVDEDIYSFGY